jgi:TM2 domain-containing membrane protein YozV
VSYPPPYSPPPEQPSDGGVPPQPPPYPGQQPYPGQAPYPGQQPYPGQPYPGQPYPPGAYVVDPYAKSKLVAGLLGIFLGGFGIHRFYLGYVGIGILQIVVTIFTLGLGGLWGFIEGIVYLAANQGPYTRDATGRPLRP